MAQQPDARTEWWTTSDVAAYLGVGVSKDWNLWTDATFINVSDGRYGLDVSGWSRVGTVGLDRKITNSFVLGLSISLEDSMTGGYGGFFSATARGISFGPYAAVTLSDNWAVDLWLSYGRLRPLHTNAVIFAFGGCALFATSYHVVQRTCQTPLLDFSTRVALSWATSARLRPERADRSWLVTSAVEALLSAFFISSQALSAPRRSLTSVKPP